jgi:hypothetical protein
VVTIRKQKLSILLIIGIFGILSVSNQTSPATAEVYPEGLISYWKFDEGRGTVATDSVGGNDGTIFGSTWTAGQVGNALSFDPLTADHIVVNHDSSLNTVDMTFELWVNPNSNELPSTFLLNKYTLSTGFFVRGITGNKWLFHLNGWTVSTTSDIAVSDWVHLAGTYDGSYLRIYVNGVNENSVPKTGLENNNIMDLLIGSSDGGAYFDGTMDEIALYNRALTSEEIEQHYENGLDGKGYEVPEPFGTHTFYVEYVGADITDDHDAAYEDGYFVDTTGEWAFSLSGDGSEVSSPYPYLDVNSGDNVAVGLGLSWVIEGSDVTFSFKASELDSKRLVTTVEQGEFIRYDCRRWVTITYTGIEFIPIPWPPWVIPVPYQYTEDYCVNWQAIYEEEVIYSWSDTGLHPDYVSADEVTLDLSLLPAYRWITQSIEIGDVTHYFRYIYVPTSQEAFYPLKYSPWNIGDGYKINMYDTPTQSFSRSIWTYVAHGWVEPSWSEVSAQDKHDLINTATFELSIWYQPPDPEFPGFYAPQGLPRLQWFDSAEDTMYVLYYRQWLPNIFEVGTHYFKGEWYVESSGVPTTITMYSTVIVTL